jgi:hypothetical protein
LAEQSTNSAAHRLATRRSIGRMRPANHASSSVLSHHSNWSRRLPLSRTPIPFWISAKVITLTY